MIEAPRTRRPRVRKPRFQLFMEKVRIEGECWLWTASTDKDGYGSFYSDEGTVRAHRFAYTTLVGPIPDGLELDHTCRVPGCVNPAHLEPVTQKINNQRSSSPSAQRAVATECKRGHPLSGENLHITPSGHRKCRACHRNYLRDWRARKSESRVNFS